MHMSITFHARHELKTPTYHLPTNAQVSTLGPSQHGTAGHSKHVLICWYTTPAGNQESIARQIPAQGQNVASMHVVLFASHLCSQAPHKAEKLLVGFPGVHCCLDCGTPLSGGPLAD